MERKLVKQGHNALTVTLPAKWIKEKGLEAGQTVSVETEDDNIKISSKAAKKSEITVDVKDEERSEVYHHLQAKYLEGYDKIIVLHNNAELVQEVSQSLMGMIIEEHAPTKTIISNIILVPEDNFNVVLRRATHILVQHAKNLIDICDKNKTNPNMRSEENLLDFNLRYCMRYLNKYSRDNESYKYFLLCSTLEKAGDLISEIAKYVGNEIEIAKKIAKMVSSYVECFFASNFKKIYSELKSFKNSLKAKTYLEGLCSCLQELLYDNVGYLIEKKR